MPKNGIVDSQYRLQKELARNKVMSTSQLEKFVSGRVVLTRMAEEGKIVPLGSGLYASPTIDPFVASVLAVPRFYPDAIISNLTALVVHGLSDERLDQIDVDIERSRSIRNRLLRVHRVPEHRLIGVATQKFHGEKLRIYDLERSLSDAYRLDRGGPIFFKALKRYLKGHKLRTDIILKYDEALKTRVLHHVQQELADA
jgi:predicted transcriptional regulator of viral defense system